MSEAHERHQNWTPERLLSWTQTIGSATHAMVDVFLQRKSVPEQAYRACLGLLFNAISSYAQFSKCNLGTALMTPAKDLNIYL